jgi:acyl CoA:acetate/3-ketoacid CoA transferase beta subunit
MALVELADGVTLDEVKAKTEANFRVALGDNQTSSDFTISTEREAIIISPYIFGG